MIVSKFGMQKRKPSESFQFLSFRIFGRYVTWFYLIMSFQMLIYATQKIISLYKEFHGVRKSKSQKLVYKPVFTPFSAVGFFDGSSKEGRCGCGMVLKLNYQYCFNLWMGGEVGSNTKDELLGLWGVLFFASKCGNLECLRRLQDYN